MFWGEKRILKKGFVMIYTLILGLIILLISSYIFMLEASKKVYILDSKKNVTEKIYSRETTNYLLSQMNSYILSNTNNVNKSELYKLFSSSPDKNKIGNNDYFIYYSIYEDTFIVSQSYRGNRIKKDTYNYNFIDGKINYMYFSSKYQ